MACRGRNKKKTKQKKQECPEHLPSSHCLFHIPYKDRCDWLPTLCLINTALSSSPYFPHTLSTLHFPSLLAFKALIGDCWKTHSRNRQIWTEIKMEITQFSWEWGKAEWRRGFDEFCLLFTLYLDGGSRGEIRWGDLKWCCSQAQGQLWNRCRKCIWNIISIF